MVLFMLVFGFDLLVFVWKKSDEPPPLTALFGLELQMRSTRLLETPAQD
jgi:hypothetical protein